MQDTESILDVMEVISKEARRLTWDDENVDAEDVTGEAVLRWVEMGMPNVGYPYIRKMVSQVTNTLREMELQQAYAPAYTPSSIRKILKKYPPPDTRKDVGECLKQLRPEDAELIISAYSSRWPTLHSAEERSLYRAIDNLTLKMNMYGYGARRKASGNASEAALIQDNYQA